jgi:hypothetical protein
VHRKYDARIMGSLDNDIAIIELQSEVTFSPTVAPICNWPGAGEHEVIEGLKGTVILVKICFNFIDYIMSG